MISDKLKSVILEELDLDEWDIQGTTQANEVPGWDSLNHTNVILAIEEAYDVKLKSFEILKCKNIGDLQNLVDSKTG